MLREPPNPEWILFVKVAMGPVMVLILAALVVALGFGHVEEKTSFGLEKIIEALVIFTAQWCQWAFSRGGKEDK